MEGPLSKWTNVMKGWQYRWFVLDDSAGLLSYYTSKDKMVRGARRGCVRLRNAVVGIDDDDDSTFTITVDAKTFHFQAHDADERETWIRALEDTILRHALAMTRRWDPNRPPPTMADFDKKLTESDGYLQLLIDQAQQLQQLETHDDEDRRRSLHVLGRLNTLLETVKHSIVLLQIAKNTAFPANGVYQPCNAAPEAVAAASASSGARSLPSVGASALSDNLRKADSVGNVGSSGGSGGNSSDDGATGGTSGGGRAHRSLQRNTTANGAPSSATGGAGLLSSSAAAGVSGGLSSSPTQRRLVRGAGVGYSSSSSITASTAADDGDGDSDDPVSLLAVQVHTGIEVAREAVVAGGGVGPRTSGGAGAGAAASNMMMLCSNSVPDTSYSSSEDEDFFDADEFSGNSSGPRLFDDSNSTAAAGGGAGGAAAGDDGSSSQALLAHINSSNNYSATDTSNTSLQRYDSPKSPVVSTAPSSAADGPLLTTEAGAGPVAANSGFDYDSLYDDEDDQDQVSMESQGFIIQHLISQVKIGMDLTKVVLPTFILERRSLLEMYADFFAHPDLFCSISAGSNPRERMVAVLKWYMSAFHAGRRSEVAKKPYNPIIGELFKCHWDLPGEPVVTGGREDSGKPMPWVQDGQLAFVAEQVSHHPPISAFYAENVSKRISFCGHIWTKSKFLGLSVCVYNIGQGCVSVLDHDEEYIVNFPSGYGRSILTVPWVELGGSCQITCSRTGYNANIEFLTKPFYGGKKHRVSAEVFSPGEKKPFLTVDGEWNGAMTAKWAEDGRTEPFVDTRSLGIVRKKVKLIAEQLPNESRALWKECTAGLKFNNIDAATEAKYKLEQKQREEAKQRKEANEAWQTKLFSLMGENWIYHSPLVSRMANSGAAAS